VPTERELLGPDDGQETARARAYLRELGYGTGPSDDEELDALVAAARVGEGNARERLIVRFLPLINALARVYAVPALEQADLVQEGVVGLLRALWRYDPTRGVPFPAYARWWIREALQEARSDFIRPFRIPPKALRQLARLKSASDELYLREGRRVSDRELGRLLDLDERQIDALRRADAALAMLDAEREHAADGGRLRLGEPVRDPAAEDAYEEVLASVAGEQLHAFLRRLSERERAILRARYGLDGERERSLGEIAGELGVSVERVRQLNERALGKLRQSASVGA
jgi:RNA polymerase primary sigma factor